MLGSIFAALGGLAFVTIGLAAIVAPGLSSAQYGLPTNDRTALALIGAIGARDVVLGLIVLLLLASRERDAVGLVLAVSVLAALGDIATVKAGRDDVGPRQLAVHAGGAGALLAAWALLRSGR